MSAKKRRNGGGGMRCMWQAAAASVHHSDICSAVASVQEWGDGVCGRQHSQWHLFSSDIGSAVASVQQCSQHSINSTLLCMAPPSRLCSTPWKLVDMTEFSTKSAVPLNTAWVPSSSLSAPPLFSCFNRHAEKAFSTGARRV